MTNKTYKTLSELSGREYYRNAITGQVEELPQTQGIASRPASQPQQDEEMGFLESWAGPILRRIGAMSDDPEIMADTLVPELQRNTFPSRTGLEAWRSLPPPPTAGSIEGVLNSVRQTREALRDMPERGSNMDEIRRRMSEEPDAVNVEGSTRGTGREMIYSDGTQPARPRGSSSDDDLIARIEERLIPLEHFVGEAYKPVESEEYYTIGYGHYGPQVNPNDTMTREEARQLLRQDIEERLPAIRRNIPAYDSLSPELQVEIAQGWFRGDMSGSPKTIALINEGRFEEAAEEFLDNEEYRTAEAEGKPGIRPRMEAISAALRAEARR